MQTWAGTDRQCRGRLLAVLRDSDGPGPPQHASTPPGRTRPQRIRCLASLVEDGLVVHDGPETYALP